MSRLIPALAATLAGLSSPAQPDTWAEQKCALFASAWAEVTDPPPPGLSPGFTDETDSFIASGCATGAVCPRSPQDLALADTLTLMAVAEGMAGSFLPYACSD
ncbi:hypothetical protein [Algicella marina]|uniref:Uncharacterized protein n=1 Tax=Algicella marina TaxID=2683284 RepID=A0A6P1SV62_9RHOB|nr:hypothetical protein [Algicella marina]QHQ34338.1 hypothetical protein GO499_03620 [Algicella marina]